MFRQGRGRDLADLDPDGSRRLFEGQPAGVASEHDALDPLRRVDGQALSSGPLGDQLLGFLEYGPRRADGVEIRRSGIRDRRVLARRCPAAGDFPSREGRGFRGGRSRTGGLRRRNRRRRLLRGWSRPGGRAVDLADASIQGQRPLGHRVARPGRL